MSAFRICAALMPTLAFPQVAVPTANYDTARTGANMDEVYLNAASVHVSRFGKLFSRAVDASIYAHPLYVPSVKIGRSLRNVVYVATMNNTVYAFDADDPQEAAPLWANHLGPAPPGDAWIGPLTWGILGTPAIDLSSGIMYLVAAVGADWPSAGLYVYGLDIATGAVRVVRGELLFPNDSGALVRATRATIQRAGLLVANNALYIAIANFKPDGTHLSQEGFVLGYRWNDLSAPFARFRSTPTGLKGGIWQSGRGLAADSNSQIYAAISGGTYDSSGNFGSSIVKLNPKTLSVVDWFTPANHDQLYHGNLDPSAGGTIVIPGANYLTAGGKEGVIYLLDRSSMGKLETASTGPLQSFQATQGCGQQDCAQTLSSAYWNRSPSPALFLWDKRDVLRSIPFTNSRLQPAQAAAGTVASQMAAGLSISSNQSAAASGIVWAVTTDQNANDVLVPATLRAFDAADVTRELWNSSMNSSRDAVGMFTKFAPPVVANGKVYVVTHSNRLETYGLLCAADVTPQVSFAREPIRNIKQTFQQTVTIRNTGRVALAYPLTLALDDVPPGVTVTNARGFTNCSAPAGNPYIVLNGPDAWLKPDAAIKATLTFSAPGAAAIMYRERLLGGSPVP